MADQVSTNAGPRRRSDGEATHAAILEKAMRLASTEGLGSLTIGRLSRELGVSKSGVFAHFRSKERLQKETIGAAREVFEQEVLDPGLAATEGLAQLQSLCEAYLSYLERGVFPGGCFFAQLLGEFDAQAGPIYEEVRSDHGGWFALLARNADIARQRGELARNTDCEQLAFELYAALELANFLSILHRDTTMIERGRTAFQTALASAAPRSPDSYP